MSSAKRHELHRAAASHLARCLWSLLWFGVVALLVERSLPGLKHADSPGAPDALTMLLTLAGIGGSLLACGCWRWASSAQEPLAAVWAKLWFGLLPGLLLPGLLWQVEPALLTLGAAGLLAVSAVVFLKSPVAEVPVESPLPTVQLDAPPPALKLVDEETESEPPADDPGLLLSFARRMDDQRGETIEGTARLAFAAGEANCVLHLPISPPLAGIPQVECQPLAAAPSVRINVTARHPYGLRIEGRRSLQLDSPLLVPVWFQVSASARRVA